ncbi:peptide ABC transporter ATP-binding protein [Aeromicrobium sp. PE09-221]|uniref:ABC transporter ATP-binding protein n=1 Tax=Aeromicrobium sp. PE09-221 TaxID=1898043 RepID=UPI000B3E55F1|nr:ABC transporter ATP-binding protein [Aeromicrobium sp. PE09-221]OUZ10330.1 peptide ABC transporter ATP-binding protein [Aeromicrobium sp. PE09-221]
MSGVAGRRAVAAVEARDVCKSYRGVDAEPVLALDHVSLRVEAGEMVAVMGPSGAGKSTLLNVLAGLDRADSGTIAIAGSDITGMSDRRLTALRRERIGFVFQGFNLLPQLTAAQNIVLPFELARRRPDPQRLDRLAKVLRISDRLSHRPGELSGGQQQRIAVARALLPAPDIVFADEPTGALDSHSSAELLGFLRDAVDREGQSVVLVTHEDSAAAYADRTIQVVDGRTR